MKEIPVFIKLLKSTKEIKQIINAPIDMKRTTTCDRMNELGTNKNPNESCKRMENIATNTVELRSFESQGTSNKFE